MNRRELGKGLLGFLAGLGLGIPFANGKESEKGKTYTEEEVAQMQEPFIKRCHDEYEGRITIIRWTPVEDELPKETGDVRGYLVRYGNGVITTIDASAARWWLDNFQGSREPGYEVTDWAHLPK